MEQSWEKMIVLKIKKGKVASSFMLCDFILKVKEKVRNRHKKVPTQLSGPKFNH